MSTLIEKEGRYFKECNVVMLPTEAKTDVILVTKGIGKNQLHYYNHYGSADKSMGDIYQHLYITSNDKIKEDSWCIYQTASGLWKLYGKIDKEKVSDANLDKDYYKIIATTDKSLSKIISKEYDNFRYDKTKYLPQISDNFIKEYYKQGGINKVLVEYHLGAFDVGKNFDYIDSDYILKTDSHNTITIKPFEEKMYSKEELIQLSMGQSDVIDWIEENL